MFGLSEKDIKFEKNLPYGFDVYLVNVQSMRKIAKIFVCFSESPKFINMFVYYFSEQKSTLFSLFWPCALYEF